MLYCVVFFFRLANRNGYGEVLGNGSAFVVVHRHGAARAVFAGGFGQPCIGAAAVVAHGGAVVADIISLTKDDEKYKFIDLSVASIFIDDSFSERFSISDKLNIPVFDLDAIESLINWKM